MVITLSRLNRMWTFESIAEEFILLSFSLYHTASSVMPDLFTNGTTGSVFLDTYSNIWHTILLLYINSYEDHIASIVHFILILLYI